MRNGNRLDGGIKHLQLRDNLFAQFIVFTVLFQVLFQRRNLLLLLHQTLFAVLVEIFHNHGADRRHIQRLVIHSLEHNQLRIVQFIIFHFTAGDGNRSFRHFLTYQDHPYLMVLALMVDFLIQYLRILKGKLLVYKAVGSAFKEGVLNNSHCEIHRRTHRKDSYQHDILPHLLFTVLIHKLLALEVHYPYADKSSQTDEYGVYEIKVECTEEINQVSRCQSITCRTQRRHQCRGNGDTRNHIAFLLRGECHYSRKTAHQCDEYVINCRRCAGQQL